MGMMSRSESGSDNASDKLSSVCERRTKIITNKNVKFSHSKGDFPKSKDKGKNAFSLDSMIRNAKVVEKVIIKPFEQNLLDQGMIPGRYFEEYMAGVESKIESFQRWRDPEFERQYGQLYHNFRQDAWKKALKKERTPLSGLRQIKGTGFAPPQELILMSDPFPDGTFVTPKYSVKLLPGRFREIDILPYELAQIASGLLPGKVSMFGSELDYKRTFECEWKCRYVDELQELKHIYKSFWYLTTSCRKNWIGALSSISNDRVILDYNQARYVLPDGQVLTDDYVLFDIEGHEVWTTVENVYKWICWSRLEGKEYSIGEPESNEQVLYALLLEWRGVEEERIKSELTLDYVLQQLEITVGVLNELNNRDYFSGKPEDPEDEEGIPDEWRLLIKNIRRDETPEEIPSLEETYPNNEPIEWIRTSIDLEAMAMEEDSEDDFSSSESEEEEETIKVRPKLPYNKNLHLTNEEFTSLEMGYEVSSEEESSETRKMIVEVLHPTQC